MKREQSEAALQRWALLGELQKAYPDFIPFLEDGMRFLGFSVSEIQRDIANYIAYGPQNIMVQAQRGQAKTTIAALYAIWCLMHHPHLRVLIVTAAGPLALEISTLIVRLIGSWDILECMRPDENAGDRSAVEHFDIHHSLKGVNKSPSVACVGIGASMQGKRADLLLADDIESSKNSATAVQRSHLLHLTLDFASICDGCESFPARQVWLGTPQSVDSIYNALPGRGIVVRIWPGRYPTEEQRSNYGDFLAPFIERRLSEDPSLGTGGGFLGDQGKPTDPYFITEDKLCQKEQQQGQAYFQLQHMLNTRLSDAMRFPLKPERVICMRLGRDRHIPVHVIPGHSKEHLHQHNYGEWRFTVNTPAATEGGYTKLEKLTMYIDPAPGGQNGDESGYAIGGVHSSTVFLLAAGGVPGGYDLPKMELLADIAQLWGVETVVIEKNLGFGALREVLGPVLRRALPDVGIEDDLVHGQKELRILGTLEPIIGRGSLVVNLDILEGDWASAKRYPTATALSYSLMFQLSKLTRDRNALLHDDRLDAVEGLCRRLQPALQHDPRTAREAAHEAAARRLMEDPLGRKRYGLPEALSLNSLQRRMRRR